MSQTTAFRITPRGSVGRLADILIRDRRTINEASTTCAGMNSEFAKQEDVQDSLIFDLRRRKYQAGHLKNFQGARCGAAPLPYPQVVALPGSICGRWSIGEPCWDFLRNGNPAGR
jgi:hypothetical protein